MARRSYDRMYREYDVKEFENKMDTNEVKEEDSLPKADIEGDKKAKKRTGKVTGGLNLNVRKQPKANGEILTTIGPGSTVEIIEEVDDWYKISSPNGFVMKQFVQI